MLFNSYTFLVFAALFFLVWRAIPRRPPLQWGLLIGASCVFYGWWDWRFLFLLAGTGLVDFLAALAMERAPSGKKALLIVSMCCNVGVLATFKYLGFFTTSLNAVLGMVGSHASVPVVHLVLPVGISFYTFQSMSYTIDVYKGELKPTRSLLHFFAMISLFPHLVAGPILRARNILPQLLTLPRPTEEQRWSGLKLIVLGYLKKVVLADNLAPAVNDAFSANLVVHSCPYWWVVITMFAMQIYFDFSGYTDIARGLARWMGIEFPLNFNHPYAASSFRDFWKRWHISLSSWWMEYVYVPLGGSRRGPLRAHSNMWVTMVISGLWHGAAWTFVVWGALHAAFLSLERVTRWPQRLAVFPGGRLLVSVALLVQVWVAWVFFRATSFAQALHITSAMLDPRGHDVAPVLSLARPALLFLVVSVSVEALLATGGSPAVRRRLGRHADPVLVAAMIAACFYLRGPGSAFIYFQF
jgi:alginate O-acetyltransferase complex protein AlgI